MQGILSAAELFDACSILFGPEIRISMDFIHYLKPEGLKAAYRKMALETHPDRAVVSGKNENRMKADFIQATLAYEKLSSVVMNGGILPRKDGRDVPKRNPGGKDKEKFYTGIFPKRKLLICQFLYYSGDISWNAYIHALLWQRRLCPPVGRMALDLGMLTKDKVHAILKGRVRREKFGESALRMGLLTPYQLMALLGKQRRFHRPVGEYFVRTGVLSRRRLEFMVQKQAAHNASFNRRCD